MASINGDTAISKFELGANFQAKTSLGIMAWMTSKISLQFSDIYRPMYFNGDMVLFDCKVIVNLQGK